MEPFEVSGDHIVTVVEEEERELLAHIVGEVAELLGVDVAQRAAELGLAGLKDSAGPGQTSEEGTDVAFDQIVKQAGLVGGAAETDAMPALSPRNRVREPGDPAVARLLPSASRDDPALSAEFRRLTQEGLRVKKSDRLVRLWALLQPEHGPTLRFSVDGADEVAAVLTDIRLVLGERLGIEEDGDSERIAQRIIEDQDTLRLGLLRLHDVLGWWQDTLVDALQELTTQRPN